MLSEKANLQSKALVMQLSLSISTHYDSEKKLYTFVARMKDKRCRINP